MSKNLFAGLLQKSLSAIPISFTEDKFNVNWVETTEEGESCISAYEYHRYDPLSGWGPQHLKPNDPSRYAFQDFREGTNLADIEPNLNGVYEWYGNWRIDLKNTEDREGWIFGKSLDEIKEPTLFRLRITIDDAQEYPLRRRRWIRQIVKCDKATERSQADEHRKDPPIAVSAFKKFRMLFPNSLTDNNHTEADEDTKSSSRSSENRSRNESMQSKTSNNDNDDVGDRSRRTPPIPSEESGDGDNFESNLECDHVSIASDDVDDDWDERSTVVAGTECQRERMNAVEMLSGNDVSDRSDEIQPHISKDRNRRKTDSHLLQADLTLHRAAEGANDDGDEKGQIHTLPRASAHDDVMRGIGVALAAIENECVEIETDEQRDMETIHKDAYKTQIKELEHRVKEMQDEMKKLTSKSDIFSSLNFLGIAFSDDDGKTQATSDTEKAIRYEQLQTEYTAFTDTLDQMKKQYYFPFSKFRLGGNGVYIGVNDVWIETVSGQYVLDFVPNPKMPQVILLLCGESHGADSGLHIRLCIQGLRLRGDKGTHIPAMDMNEVKVTCSVRVAMSLQFDVNAEQWVSDPNMIKIEILAFRGPFGTRRQLLSTIIGLVTPVIRKKIVAALAPELGFFISSLGKPICVRGQYNFQGTSLHHVSDPISKSVDALSMLHWSERDALSWMNMQKFLGRSDSTMLSTIMDVIIYYDRFGTKGNMKEQWRQALLLWQQAAERYGELDPEAFSNGVSFSRLLDCAKKLSRKPVSIHLGLQYIDGELSINQCLFYAHELCQRLIRTVEGEERKNDKHKKAATSSNPLVTIASALERRYRQVERQLRVFANNVDFLSADLGILLSGSANEATDAAWEDIGLSSFSPSRVGGHSSDVGILSVDVDDVEAQMSLGLHIPVIPFVYGLRRPAPFVVDVRPGEFGMMDVVIRHVMKEGGDSGQVYRDAFPPDSSDEDDPEDYDEEDDLDDDEVAEEYDAESDILGEGMPKNQLESGNAESVGSDSPTIRTTTVSHQASAKILSSSRPPSASSVRRSTMTRTMSDVGLIKKSRSSKGIFVAETQNAGIAALTAAMIKRRESHGQNRFDLKYHLRKFIAQHTIRPLDSEKARPKNDSFSSDASAQSKSPIETSTSNDLLPKQSDSGSIQEDFDDEQAESSDYQDVMMVRIRGPEVGLVVPKEFGREPLPSSAGRTFSGVPSVQVPCLDPAAYRHDDSDEGDNLPSATREESWDQVLDREKIDSRTRVVSLVNSPELSAAYRRTIAFSNQDFCGDEFDTVFGVAFLPGRPIAKWEAKDKSKKTSSMPQMDGRSKLLTALSNLASSGNAERDNNAANKSASLTMTMDTMGSSAVVFSKPGVKMRLKVPEVTVRSPLRSLLDFVKQILANPELLRWYLPPDVAPNVRILLFLKDSLSRLRKYIRHESFWFSSNLLGTVICGKRRSVTYDVYEGDHVRSATGALPPTQQQRFPKFIGRFKGSIADTAVAEPNVDSSDTTPDVTLIFSNGRGRKLRHQQRMAHNQSSQKNSNEQKTATDRGLSSTSKTEDTADFRIVVDLYDIIDDVRYLFSSMVLLLQFLAKEKAKLMQEKVEKKKKDNDRKKLVEKLSRKG